MKSRLGNRGAEIQSEGERGQTWMLLKPGCAKVPFPEQEPRALFWTCSVVVAIWEMDQGPRREVRLGQQPLAGVSHWEPVEAWGDGAKPHVEICRHCVFDFRICKILKLVINFRMERFQIPS